MFQKLKFNTTNIESGMNIAITNCRYHSAYEYTQKEWLKDGQTISGNGQKRKRRNIIETYPNLPVHKVEDFKIHNIKLLHQGDYQCRVKKNDDSFTSERIQLRLEG